MRALLGELAETDVIVHLEMSRQLPEGLGGATRFIASRGGHRYLRMSISTALPPEARIAMLGHELQHALEIARSHAHDVDTVRAFLNQQGYRINGRYFETAAATSRHRERPLGRSGTSRERPTLHQQPGVRIQRDR